MLWPKADFRFVEAFLMRETRSLVFHSVSDLRLACLRMNDKARDA